MNDPEFDKLLEQLHKEIEQTRNVGTKEKALLRDISKDIRALLDRDADHPAEAHPQTIQRLDETIGLLEMTHPNLTGMMTKLLAILSNAGI